MTVMIGRVELRQFANPEALARWVVFPPGLPNCWPTWIRRAFLPVRGGSGSAVAAVGSPDSSRGVVGWASTLAVAYLGEQRPLSQKLRQTHFFWADERCVPPDHPESNYGLAKAALFDRIGMPDVA
jgi:hypothetical protein